MNILFWSGGKDAFLALKVYQREHPDAAIKLLTTFDEETRRVPHQNIGVEDIQNQAKALDLELQLVPLPSNCPNDIYLSRVMEALQNEPKPVKKVLFGDLHLKDIRDWREEQFSKMDLSCGFPIWQKSMHELLPMLLLQPVEVRISAVQDEFRHLIKIEELYNLPFVQQLPKEIDPMGENGEFHTRVIFKSWDKSR